MKMNNKQWKFKDPKDFQDKVNNYFDDYLKKNSRLASISGLLLHLDILKKNINNNIYGKKIRKSNKNKEEYKKIWELALLKIKEIHINNLQNHNCVGSIFYLKTAFHMTDNPSNTIPVDKIVLKIGKIDKEQAKEMKKLNGTATKI